MKKNQHFAKHQGFRDYIISNDVQTGQWDKRLYYRWIFMMILC